jgi:hypothetical protein
VSTAALRKIPSKEAAAAPAAEAERKDEAPVLSRFALAFRRFCNGLPSWLVSAVVHLLVLVLLALITLPAAAPEIIRDILASNATDAQVDATVDNEPVELEQLEQLAGNPELDPASLVGAVTATAADASVGVDTGADAPIVEIGTLFSGSGRAMLAGGDNGGGAQFFGVKAKGVKFVFIVDSSNSMKGGKFDAARQELSYAVRRLSKNQLFYVIFFDHDAYRMFDLKKPEPQALFATPANLQRLDKWLPTVENELKTDPYDAVKFAMEMMPDAIYILSDGKFTDKGRTEKYLKVANAIDYPITNMKAKVAIHTIAFWDKAGEPTLKDIAETSGGTYRFVPKP